MVFFDVINVYGPTETTVWSTAARLTRDAQNRVKSITIGQPLYNEKIYILDPQQAVLPIGAVGELYIGGEGLARGYLNQPKLTQEYFVANPFQSEEERALGKSARLYKTGDQVRLMPDGQLVYLGRNDSQVKIRGYRVELAAIETALSFYPGIKKAIVLFQKNEHKKDATVFASHLVAYYLADQPLDERELRSFLAEQLPVYMLPDVWLHLTVFPLTKNGKLDKRALPDPLLPHGDHRDHWVAPSNSKELLVCDAFCRVLSLPSVSVHNDFFRLGGNSIKAITLTSQLQAHFLISVADIFKCKTPKNIVDAISYKKDALKLALNNIKSVFKNNANEYAPYISHQQNHLNVSESMKQRKAIRHVLLTGATGFLGCNLLQQLLRLTDYSIYVLVRADSHQSAIKRMIEKFSFYFEQDLMALYSSRVVILSGDLHQADLGLTYLDYQTLVDKVDSVIHAAALTKHYGPYDKFYAANVQTTLNLLALIKKTRLKEFNYISTISIFYGGEIDEKLSFTEESSLPSLGKQANVYLRTKCEAELAVLNSLSEGINATIFRVGNLAFMQDKQRVQQNSEDNGFIHRMKCLLQLKMLAHEIRLEQISPVDLTAQAVVTLFDKQALTQQIYHVFNPYLCDVAHFLAQDSALAFSVVAMDEFIDKIIAYLSLSVKQEVVERFLLHQGWLDSEGLALIRRPIDQTKTNAILASFGFHWSPISLEQFFGFIKNISR